MRKLFFVFATLLVVGLSFTGCGKQTTSVGGNDSDSTEEDTIVPEHTADAPQIWLDASYSMKGYVDTKEGKHFFGIIGALGQINESCKIALFGTTLEQPESYESFNKKLEQKNINWCKESNLASMIKTAVNSYSNELVFIITDGIMSGSDKQISREPTYNKLHCEQLSQEISSLLKNKNVAINVSQYSLKFRGRYYYYDNSDQNIIEKERPLYIITVGPKEKVDEVINNVFVKNEMLKTNNSLTFGDVKMPYDLKMNVSGQNYLSKGKNANDYSLNKKVLKDVDNITFNIVVTVLPPYMRSEEYLKQNGHLQYKKLNAGGDSYKDFIIDSDYNFEFSKDKLSLSISKTKINQLSLRFVLDYTDPSWVKSSSTDDDKTNYSDYTTFNFEYFMKGLSALNPDGFVNNVEKTIINITN